MATGEILLVAWKWNVSEQNFRLFFGLDPDKLESLIAADPSMEARAFIGYSGWSAGQLEKEISRSDWAVGSFAQPLGKLPPQALWRSLLDVLRPDWAILADFPEDPSVN